MPSILDILKERALIYDGATGTNIQTRHLTADDYWGKEGCNELLVLSRPDVIKELHASFFEVGSDIVETDSFGSTSIVLAEYDLQDKTRELNIAAAKLAKEVAADYSTPRQATVCGRLDRADDQIALAWAHHLRQHGRVLS